MSVLATPVGCNSMIKFISRPTGYSTRKNLLSQPVASVGLPYYGNTATGR